MHSDFNSDLNVDLRRTTNTTFWLSSFFVVVHPTPPLGAAVAADVR